MARSITSKIYILYLKRPELDDEKVCDMAGLEWARTVLRLAVTEYPDKAFYLEEVITTVEVNTIPL